MLNEGTKHNLDSAQGIEMPEMLNDESERDVNHKANWRELFRTALERARRQQKLGAGRQELGRDKSKAFFLLVGTGVALLLLFFGIFSAPKKHTALPGEAPYGQPSLGRKITPGQENADPGKAMTPMLSADVRSSESGQTGQVTPEDVGRTSRTSAAAAVITKPSPAKSYSQDYALSKVDFSDPLAGQGATVPPQAPNPASGPSSSKDQSAELKKPSLVFVRSIEAKPAIKPSIPNDDEEPLALPAGTRLVARLQVPVSSAVAAPVVAVVEYNYERDGQIVLPAGAKVFGRLVQVNSSGYVGIQFNQVEMPDGTSEKIEASAMNLNFGPLKGYVSGKKTGTKFLVRSLTGLGTVASYLVGPQGSSSAGLISTNTLMRERLADNVATAGQEELNGLAFNQNPVVTVPGNTRFYIVVQKPTSDHVATNSGSRNVSTSTAGSNGGVPTLEELRQLIQLRHEIDELYAQGNTQPVAEAQSPQ
ncbi:MAG TPA: TrbI/VirB10 family protein [Terriglobales bacterium]